jgi:hypothetical protein
MSVLNENPESVAIYFSTAALIVEFLTLLVLIAGKWKWLTKKLDLPGFTLAWSNRLLQCLLGQILTVELFHVFNIWQYTAPADQVQRCMYSSKLVVFFYVFQMFFQYLFLNVKVQATLVNPSKTSRYLDLFLKLLTFVVIPVLMILVFILFEGNYISTISGKPVCVMTTNPWWAITLVVLDVVLNAGFLALFIMPIMQLIQVEKQARKSISSKSSGEDDRVKMLMSVARRNLIATSVCVVLSVGALAAMIYESYSYSVIGKVFGCFPCVVASIANTFLLLITTKGAWKKEEPQVEEILPDGRHIRAPSAAMTTAHRKSAALPKAVSNDSAPPMAKFTHTVSTDRSNNTADV